MVSTLAPPTGSTRSLRAPAFAARSATVAKPHRARPGPTRASPRPSRKSARSGAGLAARAAGLAARAAGGAAEASALAAAVRSFDRGPIANSLPPVAGFVSALSSSPDAALTRASVP